MASEVVEQLRPERGGVFVDCTVGLGGHSSALLAAGAGRIIGLDRDLDALDRARQTLAPWSERVDLVHADFRSIGAVLDRLGVTLVDGALADLGVSSLQLEAPGRGFSFQRDEPLDMRMDRNAGETAADLVARSDERELADAIFQYGEERHSRRVARAIVRARRESPVATTGRLASDRQAGHPLPGKASHRSGDAHVPGPADLGQSGARGSRSFPRGCSSAAPIAGPSGCHYVPLTRGSGREAHFSGLGEERGDDESADQEAPRSD